MIGKMIPRLLKKHPEIKKLLKQTNTKKSKAVKYKSKSKSKTTTRKSGTVIKSGGLLTNRKTTIKKKKLLGA